MRFFIRMAFVAGALAPALPAQGTAPGWYMETKNGTGSPTTGVANELVVRIWAAAGRQRQEGIAPASDMFPEGSYAIVHDSTKAMYFVSPASRTIRMVAMPGMLQEMGMVLPGASLQYTRTGPGEDILGHHTTIYELTSVQRMVPPMGGETGARSLRIQKKVWLAADSSDPVVRAVMRPAVPPGTGLPPGVELRSTTTTTATAGALAVSTSIEVLALRLMDVDTSMFTLPAGYRVIRLADELREMRAKVDSMSRDMDAINPSFSADQRRRLDSLLGPADTTKRRKP